MIFVSFCNTKSEHPVLKFKNDLSDVEQIKLDGLGTGATGLTNSPDGVLVVTGGCQLTNIGTGQSINLKHPDIHSIKYHNGWVYFVVTGRNAIARKSYENLWKTNVGLEFVIKRKPSDETHLNSIEFLGEEMIYSHFGGNWRNQDKGQVVKNNTPIHEGIGQPHSLKIKDNSIFYLESKTGSLFKNGKYLFAMPGYTRGLDFLQNGSFLIGASKSRNVNFGEWGGHNSFTQIKQSTIYNTLADGVILDMVEFDEEYSEIYDILVV